MRALWRHIKLFRNISRSRKKGEVSECRKIDEGTLLFWNGLDFFVRGFGCVQDQVLSTYGKSAQKVDHSG